MKKVFTLILVFAIVLVAFLFKDQIITRFKEKAAEKKIGELIDKEIKKVKETITASVQNKIQEVVSPPPLKNKTPSDVSSWLTGNGVFAWTNIQRNQNGNLPILLPSAKLDAIAEARLKDMFAKQYFEHVSPSGESASTVAKQFSYDYLSIGENIASGNFGDDQKLVEAWMNSPGHRANILSNRYRELGVAVGQGTFEGEKIWIGVQIFAFPVSACPSIDEYLKSKIENDKISLEALETRAAAIKAELEGKDPKTREEVQVYNQQIDEYNTLVSQINTLIAEIKSTIATYNSQISLFNACVAP